MKLGLKNINKIKEACIELNALTVVAGVNDSGKSTVGKMLFSVIKSINNIGNHYGEPKNQRIHDKVDELFGQMNMVNVAFSTNLFTLLEIPEKRALFEQVVKSMDEVWFEEGIAKVEKLDLVPRIAKNVTSALRDLQEEIFEDTSSENILKKELELALEREFMNNVCSYHTEKSLIEYCENDNDCQVRVALENNRISQLDVHTLERIQIIDATMVESPLYLHLLDSLVYGETLRVNEEKYPLRRPVVNYHVKDLASKLYDFRFINYPSEAYREELVKEIKEVMGGGFIFEAEQNKLCLEKEDNQFAPVNVASGIKTFGVLQMLLDVDAINENRILIWDEPENHLHPEWQIQFARMLVKLAKDGITILVSSHSPYFIQAVRYYTDQMKMGKFVNYYLAEEDSDGLSRIEDITDDLNAIFAKLARPMNDIINIGM